MRYAQTYMIWDGLYKMNLLYLLLCPYNCVYNGLKFAVFTPLSIQLRLQWFNRIMKGTHLSMLIKLKKCL